MVLGTDGSVLCKQVQYFDSRPDLTVDPLIETSVARGRKYLVEATFDSQDRWDNSSVLSSVVWHDDTRHERLQLFQSVRGLLDKLLACCSHLR